MRWCLMVMVLWCGCGSQPLPVVYTNDAGELPCPGCYGAPCFAFGDCKEENICVKRGIDGVCCAKYSGGAVCP